MRLVDADLGGKKVDDALTAWTLAMANAEGREIARVDNMKRLCNTVKEFLRSLPTADREQEILQAVAGLDFAKITAALAQDEKELRMAAALKDTEAKTSAAAHAGMKHQQAEGHLNEAAETHATLLAVENLWRLVCR